MIQHFEAHLQSLRRELADKDRTIEELRQQSATAAGVSSCVVVLVKQVI
jgi:hypothetical protein